MMKYVKMEFLSRLFFLETTDVYGTFSSFDRSVAERRRVCRLGAIG